MTYFGQLISILVGVATLITLIWTRIDAVKAARRAEAAAQTAAAHAGKAFEGVSAVTSTLEQVVLNTNGMSHRLEELAGLAGEVRGREAAKAEQL